MTPTLHQQSQELKVQYRGFFGAYLRAELDSGRRAGVGFELHCNRLIQGQTFSGANFGTHRSTLNFCAQRMICLYRPRLPSAPNRL